MATSQSTPLNPDQNTPLGLVGRDSGGRKHNTNSRIVDLATRRYRENGMGVSYYDLIQAGLARHKRRAQYMLKYYLHNGTLFTLGDHRPQRYYPKNIESEIRMKKLSSSTPIDPTGAMHHPYPLFSPKSPLSNCLESLIIQTLEGYVLPLLPAAPLSIHNMHFKTRITSECYNKLRLPPVPGNNGKRYSDIIGKVYIGYTFYPNGTVNIEAKCSRTPFKLENESDRWRIHLFFGQLMQTLRIFLADKHERIVPDIAEWCLTECDINKDIKVSHLLHFTGLKIQVKHLDHLFAVYITSKQYDTICRTEERKHPNKPPIEVIADIFNPNERIEKQYSEIRDILARLLPQSIKEESVAPGEGEDNRCTRNTSKK
ncbi:MAG: hypothetical protein M3P08_03400 [Thermoproteota archaeon]|nr:hypothetical protein [Thermoproteota archaeon]